MMPIATPMARMMRHIGTAPMPQSLMPLASSMQSSAMSEPTETSMPPVSMTQVMPQATQMRPALFMRMLRKVWKCVKPLSAYTMQPAAYMTMNSAMVMTSSTVLPFMERLSLRAEAGFLFIAVVFMRSRPPFQQRQP